LTRPVDDRLDAAKDRTDGKGFGHELIGASIPSQMNVLFVRGTRNHDEGHKAVRAVLIRADPLKELQTIELRHHQVRDNQVSAHGL
jgi:hypothetical protein